MDPARFWQRGYPQLILHCVGKEFGSKNKGLRVVPSETLYENLDLEKICNCTPTVAHVVNLSGRAV